MDGENAARLVKALDRHKQQHAAVIVINCMPELMRCTRMGRLDVSRFVREKNGDREKGKAGKGAAVFSAAASWVGRQVNSRKKGDGHKNGHGQYLKFIDRLPGILKFVPSAGGLRDVKHYLNIFCYFLQPTPANIRSMVLYALKGMCLTSDCSRPCECAAAGADAVSRDLPSRCDGVIRVV